MKKIGKKLQNYLKKLIFGQSYMEFDACHGNIEVISNIFAENEETATSYGGGGIPCTSKGKFTQLAFQLTSIAFQIHFHP